MRPSYANDEALYNLIDSALKEDVGDGDHSSLSSVPSNAMGKAQLIIKDNGILAGMELAQIIFARVDADLKVDVRIQDGTKVEKGQIGLYVEGKAQSILKAERLVLNCMQRMSGIATFTDVLNQKIAHTKAKLLDTRKTTPNFRICEKWAVWIGGGKNHRFGLYDMIMLKDNHIDYAGGIRQAVLAAQNYLKETGRKLRIEVETRNLQEVQEALEVGGVDVIMLDNMNTTMMKEAVAIIAGKVETEASGGITHDTIAAVAECGVDFISVGALTHSIKSMDISLKAMKA
ncbi:MAG: carboxylating nicotinate-nucleotide diphosphorylase [Raineya sp.]|jgi:nicotinate-nucleotide pyrophosphorylase (carboxylating)|nr:carboxylating nicotinate-nucleotide diphosphorylase [Raineya sp.]